jgi:DNA-binding response OmpR family regulator
VTEVKAKILLVEDDLDVAEMLTAYFSVQGYIVVAVNFGEEGVHKAQESQPDLLILDVNLPDIDGFEVARRIRSSRRTRPIPILFLSEKSDIANRLQGLELGAEDYIPKPFDVQELSLRVRNALQRARQDTLTNPITSLPDGQLVDEHLTECLIKPDWSALLISLENLEMFREGYGFVASDDVLRAVSMMTANIVRDSGSEGDFIGHISPTDFVILTTQNTLPLLREKIRSRLEQSLDYFYPIKDREQSNLRGKRLAVRLVVVAVNDRTFNSAIELRQALLRKKNQG